MNNMSHSWRIDVSAGAVLLNIIGPKEKRKVKEKEKEKEKERRVPPSPGA
jgi:hypothetical protein